MDESVQVKIEQDEVGWVLRVTTPGRRPQEFRCGTREQAQQLAGVLTGNKPNPVPSREESAGPAAARAPKR